MFGPYAKVGDVVTVHIMRRTYTSLGVQRHLLAPKCEIISSFYRDGMTWHTVEVSRKKYETFSDRQLFYWNKK